MKKKLSLITQVLALQGLGNGYPTKRNHKVLTIELLQVDCSLSDWFSLL